MPIRRDQPDRDTADVQAVTLEYWGEPLTIRFRPADFTYARQVELQEIQANGDTVAASKLLPGLLSDLIVSWDLYEPDGRMTPITPESLGSFRGSFFMKLLDVLVKGQGPNVTSAETSAVPSPPAEMSALSPAGITSSAPPVIAASPRGTWNERPHFGVIG